jgi:hypothetical protein
MIALAPKCLRAVGIVILNNIEYLEWTILLSQKGGNVCGRCYMSEVKNGISCKDAKRTQINEIYVWKAKYIAFKLFVHFKVFTL